MPNEITTAEISLPAATLVVRMSRGRLLRLVAMGQIAGRLDGGHWRIDRRSLEAFAQKQAHRGIPAAAGFGSQLHAG